MSKYLKTAFFWGVLSLVTPLDGWADFSASSDASGNIVLRTDPMPQPRLKEPKKTVIMGNCGGDTFINRSSCAHQEWDSSIGASKWIITGGPFSCPGIAPGFYAQDGTVYCSPSSICDAGYSLSAEGTSSIGYPPSPPIYACAAIASCPEGWTLAFNMCEKTVTSPKQPGGPSGSSPSASNAPGNTPPASPPSGPPAPPPVAPPPVSAPGNGPPIDAPPCGNPINPGTGNKYQYETDYVGIDASGLNFTRHYHSNPFRLYRSLGSSWHSSYDRAVVVSSASIYRAFVVRPDGALVLFSWFGGVWKPSADITDRLVSQTSGTGVITGWQYTTASNEVETFNAAGKLTSITSRTGFAQTLAYDAKGRLATVTDSFGRRLAFTYDTADRIVTMTDPGGKVFSYGYDATNDNLISVTYPDGTVRNFLYENGTFKDALTGIRDENGSRYATWSYDTQGRAVSSQHAGGAERVDLAYQTDGSVIATDALGASRTFNFTRILGVAKFTSASQPSGSGCVAAASALTYDANGNVASSTDFNGIVTAYQYDLSRNLPVQRIEAQGRPEQRITSTAWHPVFRLAARVAMPKKLTTYTYDAQGNLVSRSEQATADPDGSQGFNAAPIGSPRTWSFAYATYGRMSSLTDPLGHATTYAYYPDDDPDPGRRGNLQAITNHLGQTSRISAYDAGGRPLTLTDHNGMVIQLAYDPRGRLLSRNGGGETVAYTYDPAGLLTKTTQADGAALNYRYDAAHRLTEVADNLGNRIAYTLDALGNRIGEDVFDPAGRLVKSISRAFDALGRLQSLTGVVAE